MPARGGAQAGLRGQRLSRRAEPPLARAVVDEPEEGADRRLVRRLGAGDETDAGARSGRLQRAEAHAWSAKSLGGRGRQYGKPAAGGHQHERVLDLGLGGLEERRREVGGPEARDDSVVECGIGGSGKENDRNLLQPRERNRVSSAERMPLGNGDDGALAAEVRDL